MIYIDFRVAGHKLRYTESLDVLPTITFTLPGSGQKCSVSPLEMDAQAKVVVRIHLQNGERSVRIYWCCTSDMSFVLSRSECV